jgi:hypothetical protein
MPSGAWRLSYRSKTGRVVERYADRKGAKCFCQSHGIVFVEPARFKGGGPGRLETTNPRPVAAEGPTGETGID